MATASRDNKHLSLKELKGNIREALQKSGALNTVKAQIRREFVEGFKDSTHHGKKKHDYKLWDRILLSVIYHHFTHLKLKHTLSVFVAESGFDSSALIDAIDIPMSLNFGTESKIFRALQREVDQVEVVDGDEENHWVQKVTPSSKSVLELLVNESAAGSRKHSIETSCQTDMAGPGVRETLDQQVRELHLSYTTRRETERLLPNKTIEERMIAFQRECEDRFRKEYEAQLNHMRTVEVSRVRAEEAGKKRAELDLARKELEGIYQQRLQAQLDREQESLRLSAEKARQSEMLEYESRQRMQRELDDLRSREENSRRKIELESQGIRVLESRLKESQLSIEARERELTRKEKELVHKTNEIIAQVHDEASRSSEREMESFLRDKATLMLERKRFEDEKEHESSRQMALADMRKKFHEMQDTIEAKNDEVAHLTSALERMKNAVMSENSSAAKLLEDYGFTGLEEAPSSSNKLDSMVLLIKKNAELETRNNQLSLQLSSTQAELDRENTRKSDLNEKLLSYKQELQLSTDASADKDKAIAKLEEDNEKLKRMLTNVRRARLALSEESKELEQLVGEQRAIIVQMRKASSRDAALSSVHSGSRGLGTTGNTNRGGDLPLRDTQPRHDKENISLFDFHRHTAPAAVAIGTQQNQSAVSSTSVPPSSLQHLHSQQPAGDGRAPLQQLPDADDTQRQQQALDRQRQLDDELEALKRQASEAAEQRQAEIERERQLTQEKEYAKLREIEMEQQRLQQLQQSNELLKLRLAKEARVKDQLREDEVRAQAARHAELLLQQQQSELAAASRERELAAEKLRLQEAEKRAIDEKQSPRSAQWIHSATLENVESLQSREMDTAAKVEQHKEAQRLSDQQRQLDAEREKEGEREAARVREAEDARRRQDEEEKQRLALAEEEQAIEAMRLRDLEATEAAAAREREKEQEELLAARRQKEEEEESARLKIKAAEKEAAEEAEKQRLADEEKARKKAAEDSEAREREQERQREQEALQKKLDEEHRKKDEEERKKKEDADAIVSARARVLARRQQQKMRKEVEEPPVVEDPPPTVDRSDPTSPSNLLSDSDIRSNDGEDSSDYDWS